MPVPWIILIGVLWIVVLGLIVMVAGLSSRVRSLVPAAPGSTPEAPLMLGPPVGSKLTLPPVLSQLAAESADSGVILLFMHGACGPCRTLWDQLTSSDGLVQQLHGIHPALITDEPGEAIFVGSFTSDVLVQRDDEISHQLEVNASPYGLAVDSAGFVRWSGLPNTVEDVLTMATAIGAHNGHLHSAVVTKGPS